MIAAPDGYLHVYMLNVGQADTSVIISPKGNVTIIDAVNPNKLVKLLNDLGLDGNIEHLIITHPHLDHYSGANRLTKEFTIKEATVAPFWHEFGMGPQTYRQLMANFELKNTNRTFLSGYSRWYPDHALTVPAPGQEPKIDPDAPYLELLGPTNGLVRLLEDADIFETNHLSIMARFTWRNFRMIITGDAQMENWSFFDHERLMESKCQVLRAAHHGSPNGTQWERLDRLSPKVVVISSDPEGVHHIPDVTSTAIFTKFDSKRGQMAVITHDTGTIHVRVSSTGRKTYRQFNEDKNANVDLTSYRSLTELSNPTGWATLLNGRVRNLLQP